MTVLKEDVLNEDFKVDLVPLYDEFMHSKNQIKRKYFQANFAQSEKNRVKSKWLEKMNQLKKHIFFLIFLNTIMFQLMKFQNNI